jgi:hypothetical protein
MIAALMLYSLAVTLLFGVAAAAAEHVLRLARRQARIVWVVGQLAAVGFTAVRFASGFSPSGFDGHAMGVAQVVYRPVLPPRATSGATGSSASTSIARPTGTPKAERGRTVVTRPNASAIPIVNGSAVTRLDRPLTIAWSTLSVIGLGIIILSALRLSQPRRRWSTTVVNGVPVFVSHDLGPAVIGVLRYRIVVPAWVLEVPSSERDLILAHEREHATAGDPALLVLAMVLLALMPWNVALWWMGRRLRFAIELDCDARVLHACPDAIAYGSLLLDVSERTLGGAMPIAALAEPVSLTERRIAAMTARLPRFAALRAVAAGASAVALVVVACAMPHPASAPSSDTTWLAPAHMDSRKGSAAAGDNTQLVRQIDSLRAVIASMSASRPSRVSSVDSATYVRLLDRYDSAVLQGRRPPGVSPSPAQIRRLGAVGGQDSVPDYYFDIKTAKRTPALADSLLRSSLDTMGAHVVLGGVGVAPRVVSQFKDRRVVFAHSAAVRYFPSAFAVHEKEYDLIVLVFDSTGTLISKGMKSRAPLAPGEGYSDREVLKQVMPNVSTALFFEWGLVPASTTEQDPASGVMILWAFAGRLPW